MHTFLISRTDSIGDVILTLPLCGIIKENHPDARVLFLCSSYTKPVVELSRHVNKVLVWDQLKDLPSNELRALVRQEGITELIHVFPRKDLAKAFYKAGLKNQTGTSHRLYHWLYCNRLVRFSRKKSDLHETELNCKLLKHIDIDGPRKEMWHYYGFTNVPPLPERFKALLNNTKQKVIVHPKSKGSAREWGISKYAELIALLHSTGQYSIYVSGTAAEKSMLGDLFSEIGNKATDITGQMGLSEFISFINGCDALVAASTGPLHIASALGKKAIGIYPSIKPMHAGRWRPIGPQAQAIFVDKDCNDCLKAQRVLVYSPLWHKKCLRRW
ncbi:MAG: glycosyltransferase family 9 protein [Bacteroidales bacterium]|nr:glycosyltransferase family 9 protein [Bacteroidales bacterium]